ncbi:MAG TPA: HEAT repeat domain-containing protein [Gemmataceae bacterium]|nr:HEAT repeat domain-containing protein [Gemmataceae bacterium]
MSPRYPALCCLFALLVLTAAGRPADAEKEAAKDPELAQHFQTLKDHKVATDGPTLLTYFRDRTLSDEDRAKLAAVVRQLGDDQFAVRERATQQLKAAGRAAVPFLKQAVNDPDLEVRRRATRCLEAIEEGSELPVTAAAARVLAVRNPAGTVEALLAYLPFAADETVEEAVLTALATAGLRDGKADPALVKAAGSKEPTQRMAAAFVVGKAGPGQRRPVAKLLTDPDARVRFHAAAALTFSGDKAAVPALIALLNEGPLPLAWRVDDLLCQLAGDKGPKESLGAGDEASRRKIREAWEEWWKANAGKADLARLRLEEPLLGLNLICDYDGVPGAGGQVWECGADGKPRWKLAVPGAIDARILPGGRVLVAEHNTNRITERDRANKVLWETRTTSNPVSCQRLPNGNTFLATYNELREVTREGKAVFSYQKPGSIYYAEKLRNGHILYVTSNGQVIELDGTGKELRTVRVGNTGGWGGVELLPGGRLLVALYSEARIVELDASGKVHWEVKVQNPTWATRLRNGNTLVASTEGKRVVEFDRNGKEVWKQATEGRPFRVRRY